MKEESYNNANMLYVGYIGKYKYLFSNRFIFNCIDHHTKLFQPRSGK